MKIKRLIGGALESNGYILYQEGLDQAYIIDPGYQYKRFLKFLEEKDLKLKGILLTHHHYDHVGAVENLVAATDCPVFLHKDDHGQYKGVARIIEDGQEFRLGEEVIKAIHTPGHTEGGICLFCQDSKLVFTGDTIFNVDIGRTDLKDGSPTKMAQSIANIIDKWSNDMVIYPGHGDSCTMKYVRKYNDEFAQALDYNKAL